MCYKNHKKRLDVEVDRLSSLPDDLIHRILSLNDTLDAVKTSTLSSRWRFIWTTMTCLAFSSEDFPDMRKFSRTVKHVLCGRDNQRHVSSVKLSFHGKASQVFVKKILAYAFSHSVQQLEITCLAESNIEFPLSLFSSQTLRHLILHKQANRLGYHTSMTLTSTWQVPVLSTLHLNEITLSHDNTDHFSGIISKCANLKNLTLTRCYMRGSHNIGLNIFHSQLSNLALEEVNWNSRLLTVVAPQLKNLVIRRCVYWSSRIMISAPELAYLLVQCQYFLGFSADNFHSLEKVDISFTLPYQEDPQNIVGLFQILRSVKDLTLNMEILEELIAERNVMYAKRCMAMLQGYLEQQKADIVTNRAHIKVDNVPMDSRNALMDDEQSALAENELQNERNVEHINSVCQSLSEQIRCWGSFCKQIEEGKKKIDRIEPSYLKIHTQHFEHQRYKCPQLFE